VSGDGSPDTFLTVSRLTPKRLPRLYRRGTPLNRLLSVPVYREFALIPTLTDGEFPLN